MVYIIKIFLCYGMDHDGQGTAFNGNMASVEWDIVNGGNRLVKVSNAVESHATRERCTS